MFKRCGKAVKKKCTETKKPLEYQMIKKFAKIKLINDVAVEKAEEILIFGNWVLHKNSKNK